MNTCEIEVKNVTKSFLIGDTKTDILKDVSLSVKKGDFLSVMGPSGSGKSTLLYLIGGLDEATGGEIRVGGEEISKSSDREQSRIRRQKLGFVFQFYNLVPSMNVEENILLPVLLDKKKAKDYRQRLTELLELVGLSHRRKSTPDKLSGGEQQRVAIARALINEPDIILADEPIGNLDSKTGTGIMELFRSINQTQNKTIVMVTHSEESATYGNSIVRLFDGRLEVG
ncbi:MAG: ABC transporter ATP-binding protein [Oscillospiraceae bacterium]|nr:ABC transporter ATP-binding protein [Oscillospiraceae bacterium]